MGPAYVIESLSLGLRRPSEQNCRISPRETRHWPQELNNCSAMLQPGAPDLVPFAIDQKRGFAQGLRERTGKAAWRIRHKLVEVCIWSEHLLKKAVLKRN